MKRQTSKDLDPYFDDMDLSIYKTKLKVFIRNRISENEVHRNADAFYWGYKEAMEKIWDYVGGDPADLLMKKGKSLDA